MGHILSGLSKSSWARKPSFPQPDPTATKPMDAGKQRRPWADFPDLPEEIGLDHIKKCRKLVDDHAKSSQDAGENDPFRALATRLRICILLRHLKAEDSIERLCRDEPQELTDEALPLSADALSKIIDNEEQRNKFCNLQLRLFRRFDANKDNYFRRGEVPFKVTGHLGQGAFATVDKVEYVHTGKLYACKRPMPINNAVNDRALLKELKTLRGLGEHHHIVKFEGVYYGDEGICILLFPVADKNLGRFLMKTDLSYPTKQQLYKVFGCLSAGLAFLNKSGIRHKDIKPSNILVHGDNFLFTDFGSAYDFSKAERGAVTTNTNPGALTLPYAAPETYIKKGLRDIKTDLFSLGCIFAEVLAFLTDSPVCDRNPLMGQMMYGKNVQALHAWLDKLKPEDDELKLPIDWCKQMTQENLVDRPMIHDLISSMMNCKYKDKYFCDKCRNAYKTLVPMNERLSTVLEEAEPTTEELHDSSKNDYGFSLLTLAAMQGDEMMVKKLLDKGARVESKDTNEGATALHFASRRGHRNIVNILIDHGNADLNEVDSFSGPPVNWAAAEGQAETVELLLNKGAQLMMKSESGRTPLHQAAQKGNDQVVKLLLERGATSTQDNQGRTPLHLAAQNGRKGVVKMLLKNNFPIEEDYQGKTPEDLATGSRHSDIVELLIEHSKKISPERPSGQTTLPMRRKSDSAAGEKEKSPKRVSFRENLEA